MGPGPALVDPEGPMSDLWNVIISDPYLVALCAVSLVAVVTFLFLAIAMKQRRRQRR